MPCHATPCHATQAHRQTPSFLVKPASFFFSSPDSNFSKQWPHSHGVWTERGRGQGHERVGVRWQPLFYYHAMYDTARATLLKSKKKTGDDKIWARYIFIDNSHILLSSPQSCCAALESHWIDTRLSGVVIGEVDRTDSSDSAGWCAFSGNLLKGVDTSTYATLRNYLRTTAVLVSPKGYTAASCLIPVYGRTPSTTMGKRQPLDRGE